MATRSQPKLLAQGWWRREGTGPEFFKIDRRLYTTVRDLRTFIHAQRLASQPVLGKPTAV